MTSLTLPRPLAARWQPDKAARLAAFGGAWFAALVGLSVLLRWGLAGAGTLAYWRALTQAVPYHAGTFLGSVDYIYPPVMWQVLRPLGALDWTSFDALWIVASVLAYGWLLRPLPWRLRLPLWIAAVTLATDNLGWPLALATVLSFRWPAAWSLAALTKVLPGVGAAWYLGRREWGAFGIAVGSTLAIAIVSFVLAPDLWRTWGRLIAGNLDDGATAAMARDYMIVGFPLWRAIAAGLLALWAGSHDRAWLIPFALVIAQPDIVFATLGVLAAVPRLRTHAVTFTPHSSPLTSATVQARPVAGLSS